MTPNELQIELKGRIWDRKRILINSMPVRDKHLLFRSCPVMMLIVPEQYGSYIPYLTDFVLPDITVRCDRNSDFTEYGGLIQDVMRIGKGREIFLLMTGIIDRRKGLDIV